MYANLKVRVWPDGAKTTLEQCEVLYAWQVVHHADGALTVYLDAQEGGGSYAEPNGSRHIAATQYVEIGADF